MTTLILRTTLCVCLTGLFAACGEVSDTQNTTPSSTALKLQPISNNLRSPVFLTAPRGDVDRLFVVEQGGAIKILDRRIAGFGL